MRLTLWTCLTLQRSHRCALARWGSVAHLASSAWSVPPTAAFDRDVAFDRMIAQVLSQTRTRQLRNWAPSFSNWLRMLAAHIITIANKYKCFNMSRAMRAFEGLQGPGEDSADDRVVCEQTGESAMCRPAPPTCRPPAWPSEAQACKMRATREYMQYYATGTAPPTAKADQAIQCPTLHTHKAQQGIA